MSYVLNNIALLYPKRFTREFIETGAENLLIEGKTTKRVENRKERFTLEYQYLTSSQVNSILSLFQLNSVLSFTVSETNMPIGPTDVLMDIKGREYPPSGKDYMENLSIILTEVI